MTHLSQFIDLGFKFGDGLFKIQIIRVHGVLILQASGSDGVASMTAAQPLVRSDRERAMS
jgi:hypothetical protein